MAAKCHSEPMADAVQFRNLFDRFGAQCTAAGQRLQAVEVAIQCSKQMINCQRLTLLLCTQIWFTVFAPQSFAQAPVVPRDTSLMDATSRTQVVNALADNVRDMYVFPDVAEKIERALRNKLKAGGYDHLKYSVGLESALTHDMQQISHDLHLFVQYNAETLPLRGTGVTLNADDEAATLKLLKASNFGVSTVKKLPGDIGYLQLDGFEPVKYSENAIAAAMTQLVDCAALIVDLRGNGGGEPETVALLASYFFDEKTELSALHHRAGDHTVHYWTEENVSGQKFGQSKPVFLLTSGRTFSAAEAFSYDLKNLKRATLVGQFTAGGAHENAFVRLNPNFFASISIGNSISPVTKSNWEGTGVEPDVLTSAQTALLVAQKLALKTMTSSEKDEQKLQVLRALLSEMDSQLLLTTGSNVK